MKKILALIWTFLFFTIVIKAQDKNIEKHTNDTLIGQYAIISSQNASINEKQLFANYFSGFADLFQTGNGSLKFQATTYGLGHLKKNDSIDYNYSKHLFWHNTQISAGATPDNKNNFQIDKVNGGFSWAIVNNKKANNSVYENLFKLRKDKITLVANEDIIITKLHQKLDNLANDETTPDKYRKVYQEIESAFTKFIDSKGDSTELKKKYTGDHYGEYLVENSTYRDIVLKIGNINSLLELTLNMKNLYQYYIDQVNRRPLITESFEFTYNLDPSRNIIDSITWNQVIGHSNNEKGRQFSFQVTLAANWTTDTVQKNNNLNRFLYRTETGFDYKFCKFFEIKGIFNYSHIYQGLYKNEKMDGYAATLTPSFQISKQFSLPITFKLDLTKKAQYFGFLDIQYSLK